MQSTQSDVKEYSYFAGNQWRKAADNQVFEVHEPYSGKLFARVAAGSRADARTAVDTAAKAYPGWAEPSPAEKARLFLKASEIVKRRRSEIAEVLARETGSTISFATFQQDLVAATAAAIRSCNKQVTPGRDRLASLVSRVFARTAGLGFAAVGTLSALGALTAATACDRENAHAAAPPPMAPLVTAAPAVSRAVPTYRDEIGRNGAFESVTVTPQVPGRIVERHFQDGAQLTKGQLLFTVDPRPYQAQLNSANAQLAQTRAALDLAATQLKMYSSIADARAVSELDLETKRNTVAVDEAQVQAAQAALENAQLNLDYCYVHSPIDGRAGARLVDVGNVVQANTTALLLIQRLDPLYAGFHLTGPDTAPGRG